MEEVFAELKKAVQVNLKGAPPRGGGGGRGDHAGAGSGLISFIHVLREIANGLIAAASGACIC